MNHSLFYVPKDFVAQSSLKKKAFHQGGQALVEGMVALLVLLSLWVGASWLGRLQDMALQATHASRYAAFATARDPLADIATEVRQHYFSGPAHQWSDRRGKRLLGPGLDEVSLSADRHSILSPEAQAGATSAHAQALRQGWRLEDAGILDSRITAGPLFTQPSWHKKPSAYGLDYFDKQQLVLQRHTAILTDAGHASDDLAVQQRVAESALAWGNSAHASYTSGAKVAAGMVAVDAAWNRPQPKFDWLKPWSGHVPEWHLGN